MYENWRPFCRDKLLRKKGPCQELERTRNGLLFVQIVAEKKRPLPGTGTYEKWGPFCADKLLRKRRPLPGSGKYEKWVPFCADKLLRKKGPCQDLERTRNGVLFA